MTRHVPLLAGGLLTVGLFASILHSRTEPKAVVWQTVQDYAIRRDPGSEPGFVEGTQRFNSFVKYTHLGTDFGFHGPAEHDLIWQDDEIVGDLSQEPDAWAGMWHSLAGLAKETDRTLDFTRAFPKWMAETDQPRITSIRVNASGSARLRLEIKGAHDEPLWSETINVGSTQLADHVVPVPADQLTEAKFLNWTLEPGSQITLNSIALGVKEPNWSPARRAFVVSYAKASRNYSPDTGLLRDRAHIEADAFNTISGSGMFAVATAAAASSDLGVVTPDFAREVLLRLHRVGTSLIGRAGLLPHFVSRQNGVMALHPGTELSSVDTAIYYHAMLLAAEVLGETDIEAELLSQIRGIDFEALRLPDGSISHGLLDQGKTVIQHGWRDWGGETALVLLLNRIADPDCPVRAMDRPGAVWQGAGFIAELQSLFYPDFDSDRADALQGVRWKSSRLALLKQQQDYFPQHHPQSFAARIGAYGLSAGEGLNGHHYQVGGSDLAGQTLIHPHYLLMSASLAAPTTKVHLALQHLQRNGFFPTWGLVENFTSDARSHLPMNGGLNSTFEALGAYHWLAASESKPDIIYQASRKQTAIRRALKLFYPDTVALAK